MELNDNYNELVKQEKNIEELKSEEEIEIPSGGKTDSSSESGWNAPELTEEDFSYVPDPANPLLAEIAAFLEKLTHQ
jgi:hypothetical protein